MMKFFVNLPIPLQILFWVLTSVLLSYLLIRLTHRIISFESRRKHHEEVGFIFSVIGIFASLVIASVLVMAISHYEKAREAIEAEAKAVGDVTRAARALSPALASSMYGSLNEYLTAVAHLEWEYEHRDKYLDTERDSLNRLGLVISKYEPRTSRETNYHAQLLSSLTDLYGARRVRSFSAHKVITPEIWGITLPISILTVFFCCLFAHESRSLHLFMTSILAISMSAVFALIFIFDSPYHGKAAISNEPYLTIINHMTANNAWFLKHAND